MSRFEEMVEFADGLESNADAGKISACRACFKDAETIHNAFFDRGYKS